MALALAGRNRGQAQYTPDHGIGLNSLHIENIHSLAMDIIHSELCITGSVRKKCKDCKNRYYREQYRNRVREKDEMIIRHEMLSLRKDLYLLTYCVVIVNTKTKLLNNSALTVLLSILVL